MLLMIVMVIMIVASALMLALFSSFLPFVRNYGNGNDTLNWTVNSSTKSIPKV